MKNLENLKDLEFTQEWIDNSRWVNTVLEVEDFISIDFLGENIEDGPIYACIDENGYKHILKTW